MNTNSLILINKTVDAILTKTKIVMLENNKLRMQFDTI
jgi:hypothetical protein